MIWEKIKKDIFNGEVYQDKYEKQIQNLWKNILILWKKM